MYLPESPFFKNSLAGASGLVLMSNHECIVIIVLKIESARQVRYNKQQFNSEKHAKHVRNAIEMKSYPSLNSDMGCGNGWSSIFDLCVALALDVKHHRFLALCIRRTPVFSVKIHVKKCVLYA